MKPWYIATRTFDPRRGSTWDKYVAWSGLEQLKEIVSLDQILCPTLLPDIKSEYWPHIVNEDFKLHFFVDLDFLLSQVADLPDRNILCVYRNPPLPPPPHAGPMQFEFLGYDLVEVEGSISALSNCGGFPDAFAGSELSTQGLLHSLDRSMQVRADLRTKYPNERHANCDVFGIARAISR